MNRTNLKLPEAEYETIDMKYFEIILVVIMMTLLSSAMAGSISSVHKVIEKSEKSRRELDSFVFISDSFRKTCNGKCFSNLEEWQVTCRVMWNLEYIGWADAEDFMKVEAEPDEKLYYGRWSGPDGNGEVYCRCHGKKM